MDNRNNDRYLTYFFNKLVKMKNAKKNNFTLPNNKNYKQIKINNLIFKNNKKIKITN